MKCVSRPAEELGIDTFYYSMKATARPACGPLQADSNQRQAREENDI